MSLEDNDFRGFSERPRARTIHPFVKLLPMDRICHFFSVIADFLSYLLYIELISHSQKACAHATLSQFLRCHCYRHYDLIGPFSWLDKSVKAGASSFSLPFKKSSSRMNMYPSRTPPSFFTSEPAAAAEPPVAIMSSTTSTCWPVLIASACIWKKSCPYSLSNPASSVGPGSFPGFLKGTNPAPKRKARLGPNRNPRASKPTMMSGHWRGEKALWMWRTRAVMRFSWRAGLAKMGRMSSKRIPGEGKSGN